VNAPTDHTYSAFAVAAPGLEPLVLAELRSLGVSRISATPGGVTFTCDAAGLARTQLSLRVASRVLVRLATFRAETFSQLEKRSREVEWSRVIAAGRAVRLRVTCRKSALYHSGAVAQRVEAEIARAVKGAAFVSGGASSAAASETEAAEDEAPDADAPDEETSTEQLIVVRLDHDRCTISADASGDLLHRRGYRLAVGRAPLRETLAAAMLVGAGYDARSTLADPMCGSGTLAIEAAMIARRIAPGVDRRFAAESWPEVRASVWEKARETVRKRVLPSAAAPILASDRDEGVIGSACANAERAGVAADIEFSVRSLSDFVPPTERGLLITNPPYGHRVGERDPLRDLFARFGQLVRTRCPGWDVAFLSAERALEAQTGLALEEVLETSNGGIPVRLMLARASR
jgi:putative N6-adenine-specific DNA methylase